MNTCRISPLLGLISLSFLSLHVVSNCDPSKFHDALNTISGWQSIWISGSPTPTFQITTWLSDPINKTSKNITFYICTINNSKLRRK